MSEKEFRWLTSVDVRALHDKALRQDGGLPGLRDVGLLESALQRPVNKSQYQGAGIFELAAAYAYGSAMNHPFLDGNKRIALQSIRAFLFYDGYRFSPTEADAVSYILRLAAGDLNEDELAEWIERSSRPRT
jgi:death on curing protein